MKVKKLAVLTSGGDAQGMNCAIAILTRLCVARGIDLYGIMEGYRGLYERNFVRLNLEKVSNIESLGGTILRTSRFLDFKEKSIINECVKFIKEENIDAVIVIGGDGSFAGARQLAEQGVNVLFIPATVDNDLRYTDRCLGFDSAVNYATSYVENVKQTMSSLGRGVVFEVMGRYCGDIALYTACSTGCDIVAVPEKKMTEEELISQAIKIYKEKKRMPTIVVAEKLFDVHSLASRLSNVLGGEVKYSVVGYLQRGGAPSVLDRALAMLYSVKVIELAMEGTFNQAVGIRGKKIFSTPFNEVVNSDYNFDFDLLDLFNSLNA